MSKFWRVIIVVLVTWWAVTEWSPPRDRQLLEVFDEQAQGKDEEFGRILGDAKAQQKSGGALTWEDWQAILGETQLVDYFKKPRRMEGVDTNRAIVRDLERKAAGEVQLGLDLRGGSQFVVELKLDESADKEGAINQAIEVLRRRVDRFGVAEPVIQKLGDNKIIIQIPGISQAKREAAKNSIQRVASLEFHIVSRLTEEVFNGEVETLVTQSNFPRDSAVRKISQDNNVRMVKEEFTSDDGQKVSRNVFISLDEKERLSGSLLNRAVAARDPLTGSPLIHFGFGAAGAGEFQKLTGNNIGERLGIVLKDLVDKASSKVFDDPESADSFFKSLGSFQDPSIREEGNQTIVEWVDQEEQWKLVSAPTIQSAIGARGEITGIDSHNEAREIANILENPLSTPLKIVEERDVDPSLGADSVRQGFQAGLWGIGLVAAFMLAYYLLTGLFANVALILNMIILLGVFCYFDSTLTLPGIAGIVLTIGMAVDANVLIYERIREEQRSGKSLKGAIAAGYDKAFGTIFDANITTVIAALILYWKGHGPVQGFGITLTIGILTSMFTALVVTRLLFDILVDNGMLKSHPKMFAIIGETKIDFLKYAKPAFIASWIIILVGVGSAVIRGPESMLGIDFAGGHSLVLKYDAANKGDVRSKLGEIENHIADNIEGLEASQVNARMQSSISDGSEFLRVDFPSIELAGGAKIEAEVERHLREKFEKQVGLSAERSSSEKVGASISAEIQTAAIVATIMAMFGILVYVAFRYEFPFAIGAVLAIVHDVLMTAGLFFMAGMVSGIDIASGELNAPVIAAFLTIIGFSINDTIVIFDRIRENLTMGTRGSFKEVMNRAINQTLARTIITSGTTLLSTGTLYFFGGVVIHDFAFTLLVGVFVGTYSSIYIACAIVLWKYKGKRPELTVGDIETTPDPVTA